MASRLSEKKLGDNYTSARSSNRGFHPLQFNSGIHNCTILNLSGRTSNNALLCRTLGDWISTKGNKISPSIGTIIWVTNLVKGVSVRSQIQRDLVSLR